MEEKKKMNGGLVVLSVICGTIAFITIWCVFITALFGGSSDTYVPLGDTIDVIYVEGTIMEGDSYYNHGWTVSKIEELMASDQNKAIFLYVNSPGGGIYESDELYLKLKQYKEVTGRPIYAYMAQTAASGGLYVSMAADKIYANRMTLTGSIGVIMSMTDTTGLQELIGVKTENITSGKNKAMGNPLTDEQRDILQSMVNESYEIFIGIVAENRGLDLEAVRKLADGRIYTPVQAKNLKLIDEIGLVEDALADLRLSYDLEDCEVYHQVPPTDLLSQILGSVFARAQSNEFSEVASYIEKSKNNRLMYYYQNE